MPLALQRGARLGPCTTGLGKYQTLKQLDFLKNLLTQESYTFCSLLHIGLCPPEEEGSVWV